KARVSARSSRHGYLGSSSASGAAVTEAPGSDSTFRADWLRPWTANSASRARPGRARGSFWSCRRLRTGVPSRAESPLAGNSALGHSALVERHVVALRRAGVELPRPADLLARIGDHLVPLRDPADGASEGE